jgi:nitrate reductase alpha subunit
MTTTCPYTPAWAEKITGVPRDRSSRSRANSPTNAEKDQWPLDGHHRRRR